MRSRNSWLMVIIVLVAFSLWVDLSDQITVVNPFTNKVLINQNTTVRRGLDTLGGLQTLLQADVANCANVDARSLDVTRQILESRANALGVSEIVMQIAGQCRIVAEFPGVTNPDEVVAALQQTALLEFVDMGSNPVNEGTQVQTDFERASSGGVPVGPTAGPTASVPATPTLALTPTLEPTPAAGHNPSAHGDRSGDDLSHRNDRFSTGHRQRAAWFPIRPIRDCFHPQIGRRKGLR